MIECHIILLQPHELVCSKKSTLIDRGLLGHTSWFGTLCTFLGWVASLWLVL